MRRRTLRSRERLFILLAVVAAVAALYTATRIKAREAEIKAYREEVTQLKSKVGASRPPRPTGPSAQEIQKQLEGTQSALEKTRKTLADHTARMVDTASANAVQEVMLEVTALASHHGVKVLEAASYTGRLSGLPEAGNHPGESKTGTDPFSSRPMRRLTLAGQFDDLSAFLVGLSGMKHAVTVLSFGMRVSDKPTGDGSPPLAGEVVLML